MQLGCHSNYASARGLVALLVCYVTAFWISDNDLGRIVGFIKHFQVIFSIILVHRIEPGREKRKPYLSLWGKPVCGAATLGVTCLHGLLRLCFASFIVTSPFGLYRYNRDRGKTFISGGSYAHGCCDGSWSRSRFMLVLKKDVIDYKDCIHGAVAIGTFWGCFVGLSLGCQRSRQFRPVESEWLAPTVTDV